MDSAVSHEHEKPIYYKRDLFFTRLVVDRVKVDMMGHQLDYTVYYAGTSEYFLYYSTFASLFNPISIDRSVAEQFNCQFSGQETVLLLIILIRNLT